MRDSTEQDEAMPPCFFTANCAGERVSSVHQGRAVDLVLEALAVLFVLVLVLF